jgi:hypothetical protein
VDGCYKIIQGKGLYFIRSLYFVVIILYLSCIYILVSIFCDCLESGKFYQLPSLIIYSLNRSFLAYHFFIFISRKVFEAGGG